MSRPVEIAPSVLPADYSKLGEECAALQEAGVDRIHWDVMDGVFVPNLTFGPDVIASIRPHVDVAFEAHLMVVEPDRLLSRYVDAGCDTVIVHAEACTHLHRTLSHIAELGATPGVALNPHTPPGLINHVRDLLGIVLVMTVNPGFGGQAYIASMEPKISEVATLLEGLDCDVEVDGGIGPNTVAGAAAAGANVLVSGSAIYQDLEGLEHAVTDLKKRAQATRP
ncbi:MAG: ribulose-phosphate 3-epimerase [Acidimicrobiales bacterium]|nr:ribulose-phosphate 3-epimerase [Acidimicrobiales bacterium]HJO80699.1 ribulose-phosphate 3-epimerase [Acidimicrobiales bacterium]